MPIKDGEVAMARVTLKILPPFGARLGIEKLGTVVLEEQIRPGETVESFLVRQARRSGSRFGEVIFEPESRLFWPGVVVLVNGRPLHHLKGLETPLNEGDIITLLPPYCA